MKKSLKTNSKVEDLSRSEELLDVRTVSQLTGLTPTNLRMWENRYDVVSPVRSDSGRRNYREDDVARLQLLKSLVDEGHLISKLADLSEEKLTQLAKSPGRNYQAASSSGNQPGETGEAQCRLILIGESLQDMFEVPEMHVEGATIVASFSTIPEAEKAIESIDGDLLLVDTPALFPETIARVERLNEKCGTLRATLFYSFAPAHAIDSTSSNRLTLVRMPKRFEEVRNLCEREVSLAVARGLTFAASKRKKSDASAGIPSRRFSDRELSVISRISPVLECECPNHLAELLTGLLGFEQYSAECESRNLDDARMHAYLHRRTAKARSIIEEALQQLMEFEGITVPPADIKGD